MPAPPPRPESPIQLLIVDDDAETLAGMIAARSLPDLHISHCRTAAYSRELHDCQILLGPPARLAGLLAEARSLQWIQSSFAGVEALCQPGQRRDYLLTGIKGVFGPLIAEYVFAHILARERQLPVTLTQQQQSEWRETPYRSLRGLRLGICGYGSIGRDVATIARSFKMRVTAFGSRPGGDSLLEKHYCGEELQAFLAELDYLLMALPATAASQRLIDYRRLCQLRPQTVLINIGRGSTLCEQGLLRALDEGRLAGAVLDVFETEPLPVDSPLWQHPKVTVTPHHAACSFSSDIVEVFCDNYCRFQGGAALRYQIDFARGY